MEMVLAGGGRPYQGAYLRHVPDLVDIHDQVDDLIGSSFG